MTDEAKLRTLYLAGPMRGIPHYGFPMFQRAAELLREMGYIVISPAEHDIEMGIDVSHAVTGTEPLEGFDLGESLGWDLHTICTDVGMVVFLPGWEDSRGAVAEYATARAMGIGRYAFCETNGGATLEPLKAGIGIVTKGRQTWH